MITVNVITSSIITSPRTITAISSGLTDAIYKKITFCHTAIHHHTVYVQ